MKKKFKLFLSISSLCFALAVLCFGVYSAQTVNYSFGGNISYKVTDAFVEITSKLYRYNQGSIMDGGEAFEIMDSMVPMSFAEIDSMLNSKLSLVEELGTYSSATNAGSPNVEGMNLVYGKEANQAYAYFIVVNIKNIGDMPVYAITGELVNPPESWQTNSSGIVNLQNGQAKNVIFAFGLNNPYTSIPAETGINYEVKVGAFEGTEELIYQDTTGGVEITGIDDTFTGDVVVIPNQIDGKDVVSVNGYCVTDTVTGIVFGDNVKTITECANSMYLTTVVFSGTNNITQIEGSAFFDNYILAVTIPKSLQTLKTNFLYCNEISVLYIPASVISVEEQGLYGVNESTGGLQYIRVASDNANYTSIYNGEQINCVVQKEDNTLICGSSHTKLIPEGVSSIGFGAFSECYGLTFITIPNSVTSIGEHAFFGCTGLTEVTIPSSVTSIGDGAFSGCTGLTSIAIPSSVTSIGNNAFSGCTSLTSITIPSSVTSIGYLAFSGCTGLASMEIPSSVTSIGSSAFEDCTGLTLITIPSSVTSMGNNAFSGWTESQTIKVPFANAESRPSGWNSGWTNGCSAQIEYTPAA